MDGATNLDGTLTVTAGNATTLNGTLEGASNGNTTTLGGTLTVDGATTVADTLGVIGLCFIKWAGINAECFKFSLLMRMVL